MRVALVYESMFGNTAALADEVARGLRDRGAEVRVVRAGDADDHVLVGVDLLVLAAPTHALSLSHPGTRKDAVGQGADRAVAATGMREWLAAVEVLAAPGGRPSVAVFDTKAKIARHWPGSAARRTARELRRLDFPVVACTHFYVEGVKGPLLPGEVRRARDWGHAVADEVAQPQRG